MMSASPILPNADIAATVVASMVNEKVTSLTRLATGDQYFVFAVRTTVHSEYVIRMTTMDHKKKFESAVYWQKKLMPLDIPLAKFINSDLEGKHSQFPALLMMRLPGDDLCNVYSSLTDLDKKNLAKEIVNIQAAADTLPNGLCFGIADSYEQIVEDKTWYDFLMNRLLLFIKIIKQSKYFDEIKVEKVVSIARNMEEELRAIHARPFLWDASDRNVLVHQGKISAIVDVDDICFGDPLLVLALTYVGLENEGHNILYPNYWAEALQLDKNAQLRLEFYRLFYTIVFMRKHTMTTTNNKKIFFDVKRLTNIFKQSLVRIKQFGV